jgi:hypothetical protein
MEENKQTKKQILCKLCSKPLSDFHIQNMLGNQKYQVWAREGYCSNKCYQNRSSSEPFDETSKTQGQNPQYQDSKNQEVELLTEPINWKRILTSALIGWLFVALISIPNIHIAIKGFGLLISFIIAGAFVGFRATDKQILQGGLAGLMMILMLALFQLLTGGIEKSILISIPTSLLFGAGGGYIGKQIDKAKSKQTRIME